MASVEPEKGQDVTIAPTMNGHISASFFKTLTFDHTKMTSFSR